jgi:hypothetical protein
MSKVKVTKYEYRSVTRAVQLVLSTVFNSY